MIKLAAAISVVLVTASVAVAGVHGLVGMLLGLTTGAFGAYGLYAATSLLRDAVGRSRLGIALILIIFFAKFPVIGLGAYLSFRLGLASLACFVSGVLVVYCGLVWRACRYGLYSH